MKQVNRRKFLEMAGATSAAAAVATVLPSAGWLQWGGKDVLKFRAVTGVPKAPLAEYASYVIAGKVDLLAGTGKLTKALYVGPPEGMTGLRFPGLARNVRVTGVERSGQAIHITGAVDESQLQSGESATLSITVDRASNTAKADFLGTEVLMRLL